MLKRDWVPYTKRYCMCSDFATNAESYKLTYREQFELIRSRGFEVLKSNTQSDFIKGRTVVELQLGKYAFPYYDVLAKNSSLRKLGLVDVGIEIVPTKKLQRHMSSGPPYYEQINHRLATMCPEDLPSLPTLLIGIE